MKPTKILQLRIEHGTRLKVEIYGKVREDLIDEIKNTIHYLPSDFKYAFKTVKVLRIFKKSSRNRINGIYHPKDSSIDLYDKNDLEPYDYSQFFLHEFAHRLFDILESFSSRDQHDENDPYVDFVNACDPKKIKPISSYAHYNANKKTIRTFVDAEDYADELFAEYFSFTYCRFTEDSDAKGSFCNYIKLRNLFWLMIDGMDIGTKTKFV